MSLNAPERRALNQTIHGITYGCSDYEELVTKVTEHFEVKLLVGKVHLGFTETYLKGSKLESREVDYYVEVKEDHSVVFTPDEATVRRMFPGELKILGVRET